MGGAERQADSQQVSEMRGELEQLKQLVAELSLKNRVLQRADRAGGILLWTRQYLFHPRACGDNRFSPAADAVCPSRISA